MSWQAQVYSGENGEVIFDPVIWSSAFATKTNQDGTISLTLTSRSWLGVACDKRTLTFIDGKREYVFTQADDK